MEKLFIYLGVTVLWMITNFFSTFFHEIGHAIPSLLFRSGKISVYIGSYGNSKGNEELELGRLHLFINYRALYSPAGLCMSTNKEEDIQVWKQAVILIMGPLTSVLLGALALYVTFSFDLHGLLKLLVVFFFISSVISLVINLRPSHRPMVLADGRVTYNDGYLLWKLFYEQRFFRQLNKSEALYQQGDLAGSAAVLEAILGKGYQSEEVLRMLIGVTIQMRHFARAEELLEVMKNNFGFAADDYSNLGLFYSYQDKDELALEQYDKALELEQSHSIVLNNKGFTLTLLCRYEEAERTLNRAIELEPQLAYAYNNRGLVKVRTGRFEEGLVDMEHSLSLGNNHAYLYRNYGVYYLETNQPEKALEQLQKAKQLDPFTRDIEELLARAHQELQPTA